MYKVNSNMVTPMLRTIPICLIVATVAEATPYAVFGAELMTALVLGAEKKAKPKPIRIKLPIISTKGVSLFRKVKMMSPTVVNAIPADEITLGSILSESLPVNGEKIACMAGMASRIKPALPGVKSFKYCK